MNILHALNHKNNMSENKYELFKELRGLENDRLMNDRILDGVRGDIAKKLNGLMGDDIKDVLEGKKVVKLTFKEKIKYKINSWFNKLFEVF
jgi:hypothetical protein